MKCLSVPLGMGVVAFLFLACCYLKTLWTILRRDVTSKCHETGYLSLGWRWGSNGQVKKGLCLWSALLNKTWQETSHPESPFYPEINFYLKSIHLCGMNIGAGVSLDVWNRTYSCAPKFNDSLLFFASNFKLMLIGLFLFGFLKSFFLENMLTAFLTFSMHFGNTLKNSYQPCGE